MKGRDDLTDNLQRAAAFFQQAEWTRLLEAIYHTYIANGAARGYARLEAPTHEEKQAVARFLQKRFTGAFAGTDKLSVSLADFQKALDASAFACEIGDLLKALYPTRSHLTRPMKRQSHAEAQQAFAQALDALVAGRSEASRGKRWFLAGAHGKEALFRRYKNDSPENQHKLLHSTRLVIDALEHLPEPPHFARLALFAQRISGDPHCFDSQIFTGRLLLQALADLSRTDENERSDKNQLAAEETSQPAAPEQEQQRLLLYAEAGLLVDTISSSVAVFHLASARDLSGQPDALIERAGERILLLPLRQILAWQTICAYAERVYLFENPQVFEVVVDTLLEQSREGAGSAPAALPTLICTSGWPSVASIQLLNKLRMSSPDITFHYSGDFDLQGLRIAAHLLARYPRICRLWRFDPASYSAALHTRATDLDASEKRRLALLPPDPFGPLIAAMQEKGKKAYQEGIAGLLIEDIQRE